MVDHDRRTNRQVLLDDLDEEQCMRWPDSAVPSGLLTEVIDAIYELLLRDDERGGGGR